MMHDFLAAHRDDLIARCKAKVAERPQRAATSGQAANGIPVFLDQLARTLRAEHGADPVLSERISGASSGATTMSSEISVTAAAHGKSLLALGYSVDQVVHDYGDLCQAITELAIEREAPFAVDEFRTLNRCLDNAIADAVTEFSLRRDSAIAQRLAFEANERLVFLVRELRNSLQMATLSVRALEIGGLTMVGATGSVLKRSLALMQGLVDSSVEEMRTEAGPADRATIFSLATLVKDAKASARLEADVRDCLLLVASVDPVLRVQANRELLLGALANLLRNAFRSTHRHTQVTLSAYARGTRVFIEVEDRCGGLSEDYEEKMFALLSRRGGDEAGLAPGLAVARESVEAVGGTLTVRNLHGVGCVFTIELPNSTVERRDRKSD